MKKLFTFIILLCVGVACIEIREDYSERPKEPLSTDIRTRSISPFDTLPNPYTLTNMQFVHDSLSFSNVQLQPTDYYVRFLPQDSLQLHNLTYNYNLELFDYPLDLYIEEGGVYEDPTIQEGEITWQYTTVKPNFVFPPNIIYEILEECYIPPDNDTIPNTRSGELLFLEAAAFERLGYTVDPPIYPETKAGVKPTGRIRVYDNSLTQVPLPWEPVKGVKIRCHTIIKWATAYTDEDGFYTMSKKFSIGPHYAIVFDNIKDFAIWGNTWPIGKANYNMGWRSKNGHNRDLPVNSTAWPWAVVNNAAYEYHQMCEVTGISQPPANLKIWVWKNATSSSAPMLRHIGALIKLLNGHSAWLNFLVRITGDVIANILFPIFQGLLPDITVGTNNRDYRQIYGDTNHELAHASHFNQVGSAYWSKYISYIITYGAYGDGNGKNAELCGIGEMWGYAMGHIQECEKYDTTLLSVQYNWQIKDGDWIRPHIFWDLYRNNILTKKQIFDCLTSDVDTYSKLTAKMQTLYPAIFNAIDSTFNNNGIIQGGGNVAFYNQNVTSSTVVIGDTISVQNVSVSNGATLTLRPSSRIVIDQSFTVNSGSQFVID